MELTPQQQRKLEKLTKVVNQGDLAILEHLFELETKIDEVKEEIPDLDDVLESVKGQPGKDSDIAGPQGEPGEDYVLTEEDKAEIASKITVPVVEKVIEKIQTIREIPIVTENVVEVAVTDTPEKIVDKINSSEYQIEPERVKGLNDLKDEVKSVKTAGQSRAGWGAHPITVQQSGTTKTKNARILDFTGATVTQTPSGVTSIDVQAAGDARYLKLDASNDPLTAPLEITVSGDATITLTDETFPGTYTNFGMVAGSATWSYYNGEFFDYLYFGGTSLILEPASGGLINISTSGVTWNAIIAGADANDVAFIGPPATAGSNLNGSDIQIKGGNSTGTGQGTVELWASGGGSSGAATQASALVTTVKYDGIYHEKIVKEYNNIATVNGGVPAEYATASLTAQAAAKTATTLYAVPASGAGYYRVSYVATVTRAATTSCVLGGANGFQIIFTDPTDSVVKTSNPTTPVISAVNATGTTISGCLIANCKASTNLQYQFGYTSVGATTMQYDLFVTVEKL
jgi:hypothetical protein